MTDVELPDEAWLAALVSLPGVGPARLSGLLDGRCAEQAWRAVRRGGAAAAAAGAKPALVQSWRSQSAATDVTALWEQYRAAGVGVLSMAAPGYPHPLLDDPEPPAVLFTRGDPTAIQAVRVGIVGTRQCTRYGLDLARELGGLLADNGVTVVSGLAAGIDAAAHVGALQSGAAAPVAVAGTGLDTPYPRSNKELWARVEDAGLVCSETPLGAPVEKWRFPARNRIIAGLSQIIVVVESHESGGSLYTAAQAMDRQKPVFAVPGPIRSPASVGCNRLLADGCIPLCDLGDILVAVDLAQPTVDTAAAIAVSKAETALLDVVGWSPITMDELVAVAGLPFDDLAVSIEHLAAKGLLCWRGRWIERTGQAIQIRGSNDPPRAPTAPVRPRQRP